jgi:hypothetical protein
MGNTVQPIGVAGPRAAEVDTLAKSLHCPREDDLRKLLVDRPSAFLLLATMQHVALDDLQLALSQGAVVLTLEPVAAELHELAGVYSPSPLRAAGAGQVAPQGAIVQLPSFIQSPGYLSAANPTEALGDQRMIRFTTCGRDTESSLFARLLDAWQTVLQFAEMPESVDASLIGPLQQIPDELRELTGRLAAHARLPGSSSILLEISDRAAAAQRDLHILGEEAQLTVTDSSYQLRHTNGTLLDEGGDHAQRLSYLDLIVNQWRRLLDRPAIPARDDVPILEQALACCLATRLSARTGQPENPRKLLEVTR